MDAIAVKWQEDNKNRLLTWRKQYYRANRDKQLAQAIAWNEKNPGRSKLTKDTHYRRKRHAAIMAYGGYICACCGEAEPMFLSLDHVENDQAAYAKIFRRPHTGLFLVTWLAKNKYPEGFQVLCHNCNQGKRLNGGICPHMVKKV